MTRGKKAASDIPRNQRRAKMPLKLKAAAERRVREPKENMRHGRTRAGLNFFPNMAIGGAKMTYGTKKMDNSRLYCPSLKLRSVSGSVSILLSFFFVILLIH